jgi:hypothetical protein
MSIVAISMAWEQKIPPTLKLVLICLCDHANEKQRQCWPSVSRIAERCSINRRHASRCLAELRRLGLITVIESGSGGRHKTTVYQIHFQNNAPQSMVSDYKNHVSDVIGGMTSGTETMPFQTQTMPKLTQNRAPQSIRTVMNRNERSKEPAAACSSEPSGACSAAAASSSSFSKSFKSIKPNPKSVIGFFEDEMGWPANLTESELTEFTELLSECNPALFQSHFAKILIKTKGEPIPEHLKRPGDLCMMLARYAAASAKGLHAQPGCGNG